jgi:hypothetical protein
MIERCQHRTSTVGGLKYSSNKASVLNENRRQRNADFVYILQRQGINHDF